MKRIIASLLIVSVLLISGGAVDKEKAMQSKIDRHMTNLHEKMGSKWEVE